MNLFDTGSGVKAIVLRGDTVLILQKSNGKQDLPGGRLEEQETYKEALARELFEEIGGPTVKIIRPLATWFFTKKSGLYINGTTWLCHYLSGDISLSPEHTGFSWMPVGELKEQEIYHKYDLDNLGTGPIEGGQTYERGLSGITFGGRRS